MVLLLDTPKLKANNKDSRLQHRYILLRFMGHKYLFKRLQKVLTITEMVDKLDSTKTDLSNLSEDTLETLKSKSKSDKRYL